MKVTVSESKGLKTNLNVLVKKQEIDKKIEERVIELQKTVNIKGFRPGKAPVDLLKKRTKQYKRQCEDAQTNVQEWLHQAERESWYNHT